MKNKKEKVVVTGGAGFIGSHIVDALIKEDYEVHVIDNLSNGKEENINKGAIFHKADICNFSEIKHFFEGVKYVFHEAALPRVQFSIEQPIESNEANVIGTLNVLVCAKDAGVKRVIYAASSSAYGDQDIMPLVETMAANPKSPYGLQKYIGEMYLRLFYQIYGLETVSLRYFNVYGPRQNPDGAYALKGRLQVAEQKFKTALDLDSGLTVAFNNWAMVLLAQGDMRLAHEKLQIALKLNPQMAVLYANQGLLEHMQKNTTAALNLYQKALGFDDTLYTHQINYGDLLYELHEVEKAIGFWERALYLGILPELAKRRLQYCRILTPSVY